MRKGLITFAIGFVLPLIPIIVWAQDEPFTIIYIVQSTSSDPGTTTIALDVGVSYGAGGSISQVSVKLTSLTEGDTNIQGEIVFGSVEMGQMKIATGSYTMPTTLFNSLTIDSLLWKVQFLDGQGQAQTLIIQGTSQ